MWGGSVNNFALLFSLKPRSTAKTTIRPTALSPAQYDANGGGADRWMRRFGLSASHIHPHASLIAAVSAPIPASL